MAAHRIAEIDVTIVSIGQRDQAERHECRLRVERRCGDGRVWLSKPSQSGFESIAFAPDGLRDALTYIDGET
jgi:hypothetical protein